MLTKKIKNIKSKKNITKNKKTTTKKQQQKNKKIILAVCHSFFVSGSCFAIAQWRWYMLVAFSSCCCW